MSDTMTRAQAICACRNICRLCEELNHAPEEMREGIQERATSMERSITKNTRYPTITERMDTALRNMWGGLRKWDRDGEYLDDLFEDLESVEGEVADLDASQGNASKTRLPKGREAPAPAAVNETPSAATPAPAAPAPAVDDTPPAATITLAEALRRKESAINAVLEMIREAPITIVDKTLLRSLAIADVLGLTKSDRNQQLIRSAYYVGVLRGIKLMHGKLQNGNGNGDGNGA